LLELKKMFWRERQGEKDLTLNTKIELQRG
jgi:hypothetical protein